MRAGRRIAEKPQLEQIRGYCARELKALPQVLRDLREVHEPPPYSGEISRKLTELVARMDAAGD